MTKKVSLNIPDKSYEELASLSAFYKQDTMQTIVDILEVVGSESSRLTYLSKEYKVPINSKTVLYHVLYAASNSIGLFNEVLEKLRARAFSYLRISSLI